jgi:hypothetical protein
MPQLVELVDEMILESFVSLIAGAIPATVTLSACSVECGVQRINLKMLLQHPADHCFRENLTSGCHLWPLLRVDFTVVNFVNPIWLQAPKYVPKPVENRDSIEALLQCSDSDCQHYSLTGA